MNRSMVLLFGTALLLAAAIVGCTKETASPKERVDQSTKLTDGTTQHGMVLTGKFEADGKHLASGYYAADKRLDPNDLEKEGGQAKADPIKRQITYSADIRLVVKEFAKAEADLLQMVETSKGYMANADVTGTVGGSRQGSWKVRVPVDRFGEFREAVKKLGELVRYTADSQDVTDEYFDLEIRIKGKQDEVAAFREILKAAKKTDEARQVVADLHRAQTELDSLKGRQQRLQNLIDFTTITVHMQERNTYLPPEAPTFGGTIAQTFFNSNDALIGLGKALVLILVALTPWLPVLAIPVGLAWYVIRRRRPALTVASASTPSGGNASA